LLKQCIELEELTFFYKHSFKIYPRSTAQANNFHSDDSVKGHK